MDYTTVGVGSSTRDRLAEYRDNRGFSNYNEAVQDLLAEVGDDS